MRSINIGVLGLGVVGSGTVAILHRNQKEISRRTGCEVKVTQGSARSSKPDLAQYGIDITTDSNEIINNPDIDIIVELIGGTDIAKDLVLAAIAKGKHIVTANKALIALHGNEIFAAAKEKGVKVSYEASVAGGIPVIKAIREGLAANQIEWLVGIINGTGNFILTEMRDKGRPFDEVLKEAQALGYAEADPTFDVEGIDAAHKLTILGSIAFGIPLNFAGTYTEGISKVSTDDVEYAKELGYEIKHLGIARKVESGIEMRVHPTLVPEKQLIANVNGVMNAVMVMADAVGPTMYYGAGAGSEPTASAVVADIIDAVRYADTAPERRVPYLSYQADAIEAQDIVSIDNIQSAYYLRFHAEDKPGVMAEVTALFAEADVSIEAVVQKEASADILPIIMLTNIVQEKAINALIEKITALDSIKSDVTRIRVEHLQ